MMKSEISYVTAREILDSRGRPTLEVDVGLDGGGFGRASIPSGASCGRYEASEVRDGDAKRYLGRGVKGVVQHVKESIGPHLMGENALHQVHLDRMLCALDGSPQKTRLGANALLGVSLAICRAAAQHLSLPLYRYLGGLYSYVLPMPYVNILNGGAHASGGLDFQEFMVVPVSAQSFSQALQMSAEIFYALRNSLERDHLNVNVGDEGGLAPELPSMEKAFEHLCAAAEDAGFALGEDVCFALDVAASELYHEGQYHLKGEDRVLNSDEMVQYMLALTERYPIISIEDGLAEDDWQGFQKLQQALPKTVQVVGDDLIATHLVRLEKAVSLAAVSAVLIKPNQVGTLTETIACVQHAHRHGLATMISHRSGETEDVFISDLAVGLSSGQIKTGSVSRGERTAKYNQLLRIEEELGECGQLGL